MGGCINKSESHSKAHNAPESSYGYFSIFVIRRPLEVPVLQINTFKEIAHSGLLVKFQNQDQNNEYWILEYMQDSKVYLRRVGEDKFEYIEQDVKSYKWKKQEHGFQILEQQKKSKIYEYQKWMTQIMSEKKYNLIDHNCHVAQESLRYICGWATLDQLDYRQIVKYVKCPHCGKQKH